MHRLLFITLITFFFFALMPKKFYAGDAYAIKLNAINFTQTGSLGIDYSNKKALYPLLENKGQYFFENDSKSKYFHRWGQLNTFLYAIPELFHSTESFLIDQNTVFRHGIFQSILFALFLCVFLRTLENLGFENKESYFYVTLVCVSTFTFQYIRVQSYEFFQLLFFTCFFSSLERYKNTGKSKYRFFLNLFFVLMVFTKSVLFLSCLFVIPYLGLKNIKRYWVETLTLLICIGLYFFQQDYLYDSFFPIRTAHPANLDEVDFSLSFFSARFKDYFIIPKRSLYTYFPLLIVAIIGLKEAFKKHSYEVQFLWASFFFLMLPNLFFHTYGDWCLGPRYILFILPLLSFPAIYALKKVKIKFVSTTIGAIYFLFFLSFSVNDPHFVYRLSSLTQDTNYLNRNQLLLSLDMLKTSEHPLLNRNDPQQYGQGLILLDQLHCDYYFDILCTTFE